MPVSPPDVFGKSTGEHESVGESGSAFRAAAGKDLAAVFGGHSLAETVLLLAVAFLGLIGTNHFRTPSFRQK